jgi:hypothetical protein
LIGGADEGTAMGAVATAALTADLCRFDLGTALTRLHQTLLEEAPMALLGRLRPLPPGDPTVATGDPVDALQLALTALSGAADLPSVLEVACGFDGDSAAAVVLAAALAGVRTGLSGTEDGWAGSVPAHDRIAAVAEALAGRAVGLLPGG